MSDGHVPKTDGDEVQNYDSALYQPHGCTFVVLGDLDEAALTVKAAASSEELAKLQQDNLDFMQHVATARCVIADLLIDPSVIETLRERGVAFLTATEGPGGADFRGCPGTYQTDDVYLRCELHPGHTGRHRRDGLRWDLARRP